MARTQPHAGAGVQELVVHLDEATCFNLEQFTSDVLPVATPSAPAAAGGATDDAKGAGAGGIRRGR